LQAICRPLVIPGRVGNKKKKAPPPGTSMGGDKLRDWAPWDEDALGPVGGFSPYAGICWPNQFGPGRQATVGRFDLAVHPARQEGNERRLPCNATQERPAESPRKAQLPARAGSRFAVGIVACGTAGGPVRIRRFRRSPRQPVPSSSGRTVCRRAFAAGQTRCPPTGTTCERGPPGAPAHQREDVIRVPPQCP